MNTFPSPSYSTRIRKNTTGNVSLFALRSAFERRTSVSRRREKETAPIKRKLRYFQFKQPDALILSSNVVRYKKPYDDMAWNNYWRRESRHPVPNFEPRLKKAKKLSDENT